ncbi:MASE1 domain-containing protein [Streptomyces lydicus]|uniref:MASE1 domain-containing protein n=1 Tax=Streptomyces lydicus TaxID=47763 RepID=UPI0037BC2214
MLSYQLLRRAGFRVRMDRLHDAVALVCLGALTGMLMSATVGSGVLVLSGALRAADFGPPGRCGGPATRWGYWFITPVLLVLSAARWPPRGRIRPYRWAEGALLGGCTFAVTELAVSSPMNLLFLVSPCLIWAAFRFERAGVAPCALLVSTIAIVAAVERWGPFAHHDLFTNMVTLQAFNGITALTALLLAALVTERRTTHREIQRVVTELSHAVSRLESDASAGPWPPPRRKEPGDGDT